MLPCRQIFWRPMHGARRFAQSLQFLATWLVKNTLGQAGLGVPFPVIFHAEKFRTFSVTAFTKFPAVFTLF